MDDKTYEAWNDQMARKYDPDAFISKSGFLIRWVEGRRMNMIKKIMDCQPDHQILDLGCGAANLIEMLQGKRIVGVDLSETLLEQARHRIKNRPHVELIKANAEKLPFPDGTFDRVVCSEVLEHTQNPGKVLQEMIRVSKPGGRIVITVPNESLINFTKRILLFLRLKNFISGEYKMSDNMLEEWHLNEITAPWVETNTAKVLLREKKVAVPFCPVAYHYIFSFINQPS